MVDNTDRRWVLREGEIDEELSCVTITRVMHIERLDADLIYLHDLKGEASRIKDLPELS